MPMNVTISLDLDLRMFHSAESKDAEAQADVARKVVYTWHTQGRENWLSLGFSIVDVTGYLILPYGLPNYIDMPRDP